MLLTGSIILSLALSAACIRTLNRVAADVITKCVVPNTVALTFDDGPYDFLNEVVDTLESAGAKGTFFFNGDNWRCIYAEESVKRVKYAFDHGFQIASHTWGHKHLNTLTRDEINSEMARAEDAIVKITGSLPAYTRTPYGEYNDLVRQVAASRGQQLANWDFDSQDTLGASVEKQKQLYDEVVSRHPDTILSLQHEIYETSVREVLPYAIEKLQAAGYKLVTLAECLGDHPYFQTGPPSQRDDSWHC